MRKTPSFRPLLLASLVMAGILGLASGCSHQAKPVTSSKQFAFWPAAPDAPQVQFLTSFNGSTGVSTSRSKLDEVLYGKDQGISIIKPYGVAMWNGCIYVTDLRMRGVTVFDLRKKQTRIMGAGGSADVSKAIDVAIGADGSKYVIDSARNVIVIFDPAERYVSTISLPDFNPVSLAVYENELFVSDFKASIVKVIDARSGQVLRTIGKPGPNDGEFVKPLSIRICNDGNVLVADVFKCRIQKFTRDGQLLMAFGQIGNRAGDFVRPKHMAVGNDGMIYVVDAAFNNVQVFDPNGKIAGFFGAMGTHPGAMDLPAGLAISDQDLDLFQQYVHPAFEAKRLIIVSNQFGNNKIAIYAQGALKEGKTMADISSSRMTLASGIESGKQPTSRPISIGTPLPPEMVPAAAPTTAPTAQSSR